MDEVCELPGQDRVVDPVGEDPDGQQRDHLGPGEVRGVRGVAAHEELRRRRAVADPHEGGRGVLAEDDVPVAPAPGPPPEAGQSTLVPPGPSSYIHRASGRAQRRRRGVGASHPRCRRAGSSGRGRRWRRPGRRRPGWRRAPRWVARPRSIRSRSVRTKSCSGGVSDGVVAGQAHGADALDLPVPVNGGQPAGAVEVGLRPGSRRGRSSRAPGRCCPPGSAAGRSPHRRCRSGAPGGEAATTAASATQTAAFLTTGKSNHPQPSGRTGRVFQLPRA